MSEIKDDGLENLSAQQDTTSPHAIYELRGETVLHVGGIIEQKQRLQEKRENFSNELSALKHNFNYALNRVLLLIDIPKGGMLVLWTKEKEEKIKNEFLKLFAVMDQYIQQPHSIAIDSDTQDIYVAFIQSIETMKNDIQEFIDNIQTGGFSRFTKEDEKELRESIGNIAEHIFLKNLFPDIYQARRKSEDEVSRGYHDLACG